MILLLNLAATLFMTGLIWLIQLVHYPLFAQVHPDAFPAYHAAHSQLITWIVAPVMLVELLTAGALLLHPPHPRLPAWPLWLGAALVLGVWLSTALLQIPAHATLSQGFHPDAHRTLVLTNWLRTLGWSARALLMLGCAARLLKN